MAKKKVVSVTQEDWYIEATDYEEQAERWSLSDVKKTLRFYLQALECYEKALTAPEATLSGSYHILYNETRLLLQVHTEYVANNGYINILQYVKLDDLPGISNLIIPLPQILQRFQAVRERYEQETTWDFEFNLLTCYLSVLEAAAMNNLQGEDVIQLATRYAELSQSLTQYVMQELEEWKGVDQQYASPEPAKPQPGQVPHPAQLPGKDGSGVVSKKDTGSQRVEISDQVTVDTLSEILCNGFKCVQTLLELVVESRCSGSNELGLNEVQLNFVEDLAKKFLQQLSDIRVTETALFPLHLAPADISCMVIEALGRLSTDLPIFESYVESFPNAESDVLLAKIDLLQFAIDCSESTNSDILWSLRTLLNKILSEARTHFTKLRNKIMIQPASEELSRITFHLCDVDIDSSDNELARLVIRRSQQQPSHDDKTSQVLLKNAKTLLINAARIAERSCGLQENIVDKLKRNYVYNQATARLTALERQAHSEKDLLDHPFYKSLAIGF
ncbi:uncharacterized protein ZBAI_05230 [Zygosaccharomyces bailii ISA1307]|nr:uncharacterized protein ZBAI_05230 [Zygosaccharomyces bailii ISA1307]